MNPTEQGVSNGGIDPEENPLITIITVVYNGASTIEATILSVVQQSYCNWEYIIVDGGSLDGTIEVIRKYEDNITNWISEKDQGIYDAMNKGLRMAMGKWILFLNSGDTLFNERVFSLIFYDSSKYKGVDIIYGDVMVQYNGFEKISKAKPLKDLTWRMPFCHQSCFIKVERLKEYPFDTTYCLAADFGVIVNLYHSGCQFFYTYMVISRITSGGISDINRIRILKEWKQILLKSPLRVNWYLLRFSLAKAFLSKFVKMIMPHSLVFWIIKRI